METVEVIVIYLLTYASLIVVIGVATYMAGLAIVEWRRAHRASGVVANDPPPVRAGARSAQEPMWSPRQGHRAGPTST
jgi:hypothetical protein